MLSDGFCWWFPGGCWLALIWVWVWFVILGLMVAGSGLEVWFGGFLGVRVLLVSWCDMFSSGFGG